jgi:lauroyl/myristoyl acyltransferase
MRKILPKIRVLELESENTWIVATEDTYFSVSADTARLVQMLCEHPSETAGFYAKELTKRLGYDVSAEEINIALNALPDELFIPAPKKKFRYSVTLLKGTTLTVAADTLKVLFSAHVALPLLTLALSCAIGGLVWAPAHEINHVLTGVVVLCGILLHEIGHASACAAVGARPSAIGIGIQRFVPTFYTDVSDVWTRAKKSRMIVDAGGVYLQLLFAGAIGALTFVFPELQNALRLTLFLIVFSSLPYYRFDGYWLLLDWMGEESLLKWFKNTMRDLFQKFRENRLKRDDVLRCISIVLYFTGLVTLNIWGFVLFYRVARSLLGTPAFENISNAIDQIAHHPLLTWNTLLPVLFVAIGALLLFRRFKKQVIDALLILKFCLTLLILQLSRPLIHLPRKHKAYISGVQSGLMKSNLGLGNIQRIAKRAVVGKYYELLWLELLSKLSTGAGLWMIRKTHRTASKLTFQSIAKDECPTILVAPHFGSFLSGALFLLGQIPADRKVHIFYADPKTDPDNARYQGFYSRYFPNVSICFDNRAGILQAAKALKNSEIVVIMPDVFSGANLVDIELFGQEIGVRPGISYFNQKFGARLIPVVSTFDRLLGVNVHIDPPVTVSGSPAVNAEQHIMQTLFRQIEAWIHRHPEHWHCWERFNYFAKNAL